MTTILGRLILLLAAIAGAPMLLAQTPTPAQQGIRPEQPVLRELKTPVPKQETVPMHELRISKAPPPGTALLAGLPACSSGTAAGTIRRAWFAQPGGACLLTPGATSDGRIAPREWLVETFGGAKPVSLTAGTPITPNLSQLFTVQLVVTDSIARAPGAAEAFEAARERGTPEGRLVWRVRFAGMSYDPATTPREIIVVLEARDSAGALKGTSFRLFPYSPRIVSATSANAVAMSPAMLSVQLAGIGRAAEVTLLSDLAAAGHCPWNELGQAPQLWHGAINVDQRPVTIGGYTTSFQLLRSGAFIDGGGASAAWSCRPHLKDRFRFDRTTEIEPEILMSAPNTITLGSRVLYTISNTGVLRDKLGLFGDVKITQKPNMGICSGDSFGPSGTFPVGRNHVDGDLSFRIRSGPIGTDCEYTDIRTGTNPIVLPPGILLYDSRWSSSSTSKCRVIHEPVESQGPRFISPAEADAPFFFGRKPWTEAPNDLGGVWGLDAVLKYFDPGNPNDPGTVIHESGSRHFRDALRSVSVRLKCDATAINDHQVRVTLEEVVLSGPQGWPGL